MLSHCLTHIAEDERSVAASSFIKTEVLYVQGLMMWDVLYAANVCCLFGW